MGKEESSMKKLTIAEKLEVLGYSYPGPHMMEMVFHDVLDDLAAGILGVRDSDPETCEQPPIWEELERMCHPRTLAVVLEEALQQAAWNAEEMVDSE